MAPRVGGLRHAWRGRLMSMAMACAAVGTLAAQGDRGLLDFGSQFTKGYPSGCGRIAYISARYLARSNPPSWRTVDLSYDFSIERNGTIAAVDNGHLRDPDPFQADHRTTRNGQAPVIVKTTREPGTLRLTATAEGLAPASLMIQTRAPDGPPVLP